MKYATSLITALAAVSTSIGSVSAGVSKPFNLVAISDDTKINGTKFTACHEGAAFESLCTYKTTPATTYNLNYTKSYPNQGTLTYELVGGNFKISQPMDLYYDPSTNVALAWFNPADDVTSVGFDSQNHMYIPTYLDDTVTPPKGLTKAKDLYRWYLCEYYYEAYTYTNLCWVAGKYPPENPSCKKIDVLREYV